jgi:hypothetical protein
MSKLFKDPIHDQLLASTAVQKRSSVQQFVLFVFSKLSKLSDEFVDLKTISTARAYLKNVGM